MERKQNILL